MATIATVTTHGVDTRECYVAGCDDVTITEYADGYITIGAPQAQMPALFAAMNAILAERNDRLHGRLISDI